ncbi:hypothetical protein MMC09_005326 [Bachmanniomyces sp. S44760]|nr:hypothetical protein [Bachmanniomyces sp. S44760]
MSYRGYRPRDEQPPRRSASPARAGPSSRPSASRAPAPRTSRNTQLADAVRSAYNDWRAASDFTVGAPSLWEVIPTTIDDLTRSGLEQSAVRDVVLQIFASITARGPAAVANAMYQDWQRTRQPSRAFAAMDTMRDLRQMGYDHGDVAVVVSDIYHVAEGDTPESGSRQSARPSSGPSSRHVTRSPSRHSSSAASVDSHIDDPRYRTVDDLRRLARGLQRERCTRRQAIDHLRRYYYGNVDQAIDLVYGPL